MKPYLTIPALACLLNLNLAVADVPTIIHHQGVLANGGGLPVNGPAEFRFALVNEAGDTTYWSNDGTSTTGDAPDDPVIAAVSQGVFNVALGGSGMDPIPPEIFENDGVFVRMWVEDQQLTPDRQITSVGYAMQAASLAGGAIDGSAIADDSIESNHIVDHSVTSDDLNQDITLETLNLEHNGTKFTELSSASNSPILNFWDAFGTPTTSLGDLLGGGRLRLFQINGNPGITADGDAATYANSSSAGGELIVHDSGGNTGVLVDGQNNGGARIEVRQTGSLTSYIDMIARGDNGGAKVLVRGATGADGVEIFGQGSAPSPDPRDPGLPPLSGAGQINVYQTAGDLGVEILGKGDGPGAGSGPNDPGFPSSGGAGQINLYQPGERLGAVLYGNSDQGGGAISLRDSAGNAKFRAYGGPYSGRMEMRDGQGKLTFEADAAFGTFPGSRLVLRQNTVNNGAVRTVQLDGGNNDIGQSGGRIRVRNESGETKIDIDANDEDGNGRVTTEVLEITGGSDLSEQFNINAGDLTAEPGMLVSIDPVNPGELVLSTTAYDRTAAGVISGAGGVNPGMLMGQNGSLADGDHPIALTGRVYCYVDADQGEIVPGDLITTSSTPGHGMKVSDHDKAQGAIVGKAMTGLKQGRGLVLVLVSLQ